MAYLKDFVGFMKGKDDRDMNDVMYEFLEKRGPRRNKHSSIVINCSEDPQSSQLSERVHAPRTHKRVASHINLKRTNLVRSGSSKLSTSKIRSKRSSQSPSYRISASS